MLSSNGNPFLRAEYLNPPPATNTMDSKKSPLALLAQTCSQIGADPLPTLASKTSTASSSTPVVDQRKKSECLQNDLKSTANGEANNNNNGRPSSGNESSIHPSSVGKTTKIKTNESSNNNRLTPTDRRSKSSSPKNRFNVGCNTMDQPTSSASSASIMNHPLFSQQQLGTSTSHPSQHLMMAAALASNDPSCSGASAMSLANSYKSLMASAYPSSPYAPYVGHHPSMAQAAAAAAGYGPLPHPSALDFGAYANALNLNMNLNAAAVAKSSTSLSSSLSSTSSGNASGSGFIPTTTTTTTSMNMMNGYLNSHPAAYALQLQQAMHQQHYGNVANRFNTTAKANGVANNGAVDSCRDPYCTGTACPANSTTTSTTTTNAGHIHMVCTLGCGLSVQCDHLKVPIAAAHHLQIMSGAGGPASSPSSAAQAAPPPPSSSSPHRPYICNWIVGDNYCGKRFTSSDDLLQHLRTHTNLSSANADGVLATPSAAFAHPSSMMRAAYPTPPLSPLSAARYHPYGKPNLSTNATPAQLFHPGMAAAMAAMTGSYPGQSLFHPALAPYYSHLSLFAHQANHNNHNNNQPSTRQVPGPPPPLGGAGLGGQP